MDWLDQALDGDGGLQLVQQPVPRPGSEPPVRMVPSPQRIAPRAPPPVVDVPRETAPAGRDDFLFEAPAPPVRAQQQPTVAADPNAEPDAASWVGRRAQDVLGKTDKRYAGLPAMAEVLKKEGNLGAGTSGKEMWAWLTGASDKDMVGVYQGVLGDRFLGAETDANGYPVILYRDQQGKPAKAYANAPGLDAQDMMRGVVGIAPNVGAGRLVSGAMKASPLAARVVGQAMGQGVASLGQDAAGVVSGVSDVDVDRSLTKAGISAAGGAAGEVVGATAGYLWNKLVREPRFYNRATGELTPAGVRAAQEAGLDTTTLSQQMAHDFGASMARTGDPVAATRQTLANEFKIPRTQGELEGNTQKLLREQQMRGGTFGDGAGSEMRTFDRSRDMAIDNAIRGEIEPGKMGIAGQLAPARAGQDMTKAELGANIKANTESARATAKGFEKKAWDEVPELVASDEMLAAIPGHVSKSMKDVLVTEGRTPKAAEMIKAIEGFMKGEAPEAVSSMLPASPVRDVNTMRQLLLDSMKEAVTDQDKRAAGKLYGAFNDWIETAAKMSDDPMTAAKMSIARGITRQNAEVFKGQPGSPGARIMKDILERSDSAEGIVNALFSAPGGAEIKSGSVQALASLKRAYETYWPKGSAEQRAAWNDVRLAYWIKMTERKTGEAFGPAQLSSNIKAALNNQSSVTNMLFSAEERSRMLRLAAILDDVKRKNPNTSWSGVSLGALMKDVGNAVVSMLGGNSVLGRTIIGTAMKPVQNQYGAAAARSVTGNGMGATIPALPPPPLAGFGGAMGANQDR